MASQRSDLLQVIHASPDSHNAQEMYEPLLDDLEESVSGLGRRIRSIWIADMAHQGQSYVLNENTVGNDRRFS